MDVKGYARGLVRPDGCGAAGVASWIGAERSVAAKDTESQEEALAQKLSRVRTTDGAGPGPGPGPVPWLELGS